MSVATPGSPVADTARAEDDTPARRHATGPMTGIHATSALPDDRKESPASGPDSLYRSVCDSMSSGVMLLNAQGLIETFNPAASQLLGVDRMAVMNRSFSEMFLADEAFEEFNEAVLAAMYEGDVGHQRALSVSVGGRRVPLTVATAYLHGPSSDPHGRRGVVAVFSDISELESLRATQIELAEDLRAKHTELRTAYRSLEDRNRELATLLRRVHAVRIAASIGVIALVVGIGIWLWRESPAAWFGTASAVSEAVSGGSLFTVEPTRITSKVTVTSTISPRREVAVTSPIDGKVGAVHVQPGERVAAGAALLDLDVSEVRIRRRTAQATWLKASAQVATLADWESSVEVSRARRAMTKARLALEAGSTQLAETAFLVEQGLAPAVKEEAARREQRTRRLDLESAEQDLNAVLAKGDGDMEVARLELDNAAAELERIDRILRNAEVTAPVAGVVLHLGAGSGRRGGGRLAAGTPVEAGEHLVTIGDMEGVAVSGRVDEVEVRRIRPGHAVRISGPAFPGITLDGRIVHVSSQASRPSGNQRLPTFEIAAVVDTLTPEQRAEVRVGMSAEMEIVVHEVDGALVVPVRAVDLSTGSPRVRVRDEATGGERVVEVTTGITTLDSVEIRSGLAQGATVVVP